MTLFGWPETARHASEGVGQTHHVAFRARDSEQQEAWREAQWRSFLFLDRYYGGTTIVDSRGRHIFVPYAPFGDPFGDRYLEESRLAQFCMRAKGYQLVPVDSAKAETIQPSEGGTPSGRP